MEREHTILEIHFSALAKKLGITNLNLSQRKLRHGLRFRTKDPWEGFWNLVEYLESQGLRPLVEPPQPALGSAQQETSDTSSIYDDLDAIDKLLEETS